MPRNDCVYCAYEDTGHAEGNFCHYYRASIRSNTFSGLETAPPMRDLEDCPGFELLKSMQSNWERVNDEKWTGEVTECEIRDKPLDRLSNQELEPVFSEALSGETLESVIAERKKVLTRAWQLRDLEPGATERYQILEGDCCDLVGDLQNLMGLKGGYLESSDLQAMYTLSKEPESIAAEPATDEAIETVGNFWKVEIPVTEFGRKHIIGAGKGSLEIIALPTTIVRSFADSAQALGNLLTGRSARFVERINRSEFNWRQAVSFCLNNYDGRFFCIEEGLCRGGSTLEPAVYFLSASEEISYIICANEGRRDFEDEPIQELLEGAFDVIVSYSREDLTEARFVDNALKQQGLSCYLIDVDDDPEDPFWWLRYALALRKSRYLVPLLSPNYMESRQRATHDEAMQFIAEIDRMKEWGNWFPVVPIQLSGWTNTQSNYHSLFNEIPAMIGGLRESCDWIARLINGTSNSISLIDEEFIIKGSGNCFDVEYLSIKHRLLVAPNGDFRLVDLPARVRAASFATLLPMHQVTGSEPVPTTIDNIWGNALAKQGYWFSCLLWRCREAKAESFSVSSMIRTGESFKALGFLTEARRCFSIAFQVTKNSCSHSRDTIEKVATAMAELEPQNFWAEQINLETEIEPWTRLSLDRTELSDYPTGLVNPFDDPKKFGASTSAGDSLNNAKAAGDRGDFRQAELEALSAAQQSPGSSKSFPFFMASQCAVQNDSLDRAEIYLIFSLELEPENQDTKQALTKLWEYFEHTGYFLKS